MIKKNTKSYRLYSNQMGTDAYNQDKDSYKLLRTIEASIFTTHQKVIRQDVRYMDKTTTALVSTSLDIQEGYMIESIDGKIKYKVEIIVEGNIYKQLFLELII